MRNYTFTAGALWRGVFRRGLEDARFKYPDDISWLEQKGWLDSQFTVRVSDRLASGFELWHNEISKQISN